MQIPFNLKIQGVFLDSFIYMGVLYLIHEDYTCRSYSWHEICQFIKDRNGFKNNTYNKYLQYLKENTLKLENYIESINTEITLNELRKLEKNSINLGFWPSDINLFSKKLYYAGDNGVYYIETDFKKQSFHKPKNNKVSDIRCFNISPSSYSRVSLAAGTDGVHTICHHHQLNKYEKQMSNKNSIDIDWGEDDLFINSSEQLDIQSFKNINSDNLKTIDKNLYETLYENYKNTENFDTKIKDHYLNMILQTPPEKLNTSSYEYGWTSGDCDFLLNKKNILTTLNKKNGNKTLHPLNIENKPLKIRTSGCGTILESENDTLNILTDNNNIELLSDDFVSWRIYPRARSHSDHLHILNEENIDILMIYSKNNSNLNSYLSKDSPQKVNPLKKFLS